MIYYSYLYFYKIVDFYYKMYVYFIKSMTLWYKMCTQDFLTNMVEHTVEEKQI